MSTRLLTPTTTCFVTATTHGPPARTYWLDVSFVVSSEDAGRIALAIFEQPSRCIVSESQMMPSPDGEFSQSVRVLWVCEKPKRPWLVQLAECALEDGPPPPVLPTVEIMWRSMDGSVITLHEVKIFAALQR